MAGEISSAVRALVGERAARRCEYCLLHENDSFTPHQVDHIISRKHGGDSSLDNLAFACVRCNAWKGSDIASVGQPGQIVSLFHPRLERWQDHFRLAPGGEILPLTEKGAVTIRLLRLNLLGRVTERRILIGCGRYPRAKR